MKKLELCNLFRQNPGAPVNFEGREVIRWTSHIISVPTVVISTVESSRPGLIQAIGYYTPGARQFKDRAGKSVRKLKCEFDRQPWYFAAEIWPKRKPIELFVYNIVTVGGEDLFWTNDMGIIVEECPKRENAWICHCRADVDSPDFDDMDQAFSDLVFRYYLKELDPEPFS